MSSEAAAHLTAPNLDSNSGIITSEPLRIEAMQPALARTFPLGPSPHNFYGATRTFLGSVLGMCGSIPLCFCCPNPYKEVPQGYVGLVERFGQVYKVVDPGLVSVNPVTERLRRVDLKIQLSDVQRQTIMTKDNVNIQIDAVLYWHVIDPYKAEYNVANVGRALIERAQTTLRHTLGMRVLQDCIENRDAIAYEIKEIIDEPAASWGVKVESILIKDIMFSKELQESLSSAATQKRIGESKVIAAQAEVDAAKLMRQAAEILNSPAAMQIRYLETMTSMSKHSGSKVIFMPYSSGGDPMLGSLEGKATGSGEGNSKSVQGISPVQASVYQMMGEQR